MVGRYISIESKIEKTKTKYYEVLEQSAYRDFESRINLVDDKLPAIEQVGAAINEKIGKFTKCEIMEFVPSIGKASVENSLKKLTEEGGCYGNTLFDRL